MRNPREILGNCTQVRMRMDNCPTNCSIGLGRWPLAAMSMPYFSNILD